MELDSKSKEVAAEKQEEEARVYKPLVPFPPRLKKVQLDEQFNQFMDMFYKLEINIPFVEALSQMPNYVNFMKEIMSNKRRLERCGTVS